jgi:hypothetical protein
MRDAAAGETVLIEEKHLADPGSEVSTAVWNCGLHIYLFVLHSPPACGFNETIYKRNLQESIFFYSL